MRVRASTAVEKSEVREMTEARMAAWSSVNMPLIERSPEVAFVVSLPFSLAVVVAILAGGEPRWGVRGREVKSQ
jgi:hypothetical protein